MQSFPRPSDRLTADDVRQKYGVDTVYIMHQNENPYGPSPKVVEAIQQEATQIGYYPTMSDVRLREALCAHWGKDRDGRLTADHFFTGCSGYEALELLTRAYLRPGHQVIIAPPTFGVYKKMAAIQGAETVEVPLRQPSFTPDVDAILAAVTEKTKIVLLCNPNNPTGTIMPAADMDRLVNELPDSVLIVSDEVYIQFVTSSDFPDSLQYVLDDRNVALIHTFSKAYGMAGLRLGYGIAPPRLANQIGGLQRGFHQNRLAMAAGIAAVEDQAHVQECVRKLLQSKEEIYAELDALDIHYWPSQTNYILFQPSRPAAQVVEKIMEQGVIVRAQQGEIADCIRVSVGTPEGNRAFITGLKAALE